jgi:hypothetical protein
MIDFQHAQISNEVGILSSFCTRPIPLWFGVVFGALFYYENTK